MHPWLTALEELMVTSSRRGRGKVSSGGIVLLHCYCWSLMLLQEEQMQKGVRTTADHRSGSLSVDLACGSAAGGPGA